MSDLNRCTLCNRILTPEMECMTCFMTKDSVIARYTALRTKVESLRRDKEAAISLLTDCRKFIDLFSGARSERLVRRIDSIASAQQSEETPPTT